MPRAVLDALVWMPALTAFVIGILFALVAWIAHRRAGPLPVAGLWVFGSVATGYVWYRATCSQPLTCDVGGMQYWRSVFPAAAFIWACVLGTVSLVVVWRSRRRSGQAPRIRDAALGGAAAVAGFALGLLLLAGFDKATCATRPYRRPDGSIGTECEL